MKKIFKVSVLLTVLLMAFSFVSCSNSSSSSSTPDTVAVFQSFTDRLTFYDDDTWKEVYIANNRSYCSGSYEMLSGDFDNGTGKFKVEKSTAPTIPTGIYTVTITNGVFTAFGDTYTKQ